MPHRVERASITLQKELGSLIATRLKDPRLPDVVSITHVDLAPDLSTARVYISVPGGEEEYSQALAALASASGRLSRSLQQRIRIRRVPKLQFEADHYLSQGATLSRKIDDVIEEDRRQRTRRQDSRETPGAGLGSTQR